MAGGIEVAKAYVTIIPSMEGSQETITNELTGASSEAGAKAGQSAGKGMVSGLGTSMTKLGSTMTKSVTVPIVAAGTAAVAAWKSIDSGLDVIATKTGATGSDLDAMGQIMKDIATDIPVGWEETGAAIGEVNTRFGVTEDELKVLSKQFLKFAKINNTSVSDSVDTVSKVMASFGMETDETETVLDAFNTVGQKTGVSVSQLGTLVYQNAASLKEMGLSAYDSAMFLGSCDMAGLDMSTTMLGLKTAMKTATKSGMTLDETLGSFSETMTSNASESEKLTLAYELFGTRAGAAIYNAVSSGQLDLANLTGSLTGFEDSVNTTFTNTTSPVENFQTVLNSLMILGQEIVVSAAPAIQSVLETALPIIQSLVTAWQSLSPEMQSFIVKGALIAALAGPLISGIGGLVGIFTGIAGAFGQVGQAAGGAIGGLMGAGTAFSTLAGQALLLLATGAAILLIGEAMSIVSSAAIELNAAGPGAVGVFWQMIGAGAALAGVVVLLGSVSTASAVGLLALGAAVLLITGGLALLVMSVTEFTKQLPYIALFGNDGAGALLALSGAILAVSGACLACAAGLAALAVAAVAGLLPFAGAAATIGLTDLALLGMQATAVGASGTMLILMLTLDQLNGKLENIKKNAEDADAAILSLSTAGASVGDALGDLATSIVNAVGDFLDSLFNSAPDATKAGKTFGEAAVSGVETGLKDFKTKAADQAKDAKKAIDDSKADSKSAAQSVGEAVVSGFNTGLQYLVRDTTNKMTEVTSAITSALATISAAFASTQLSFSGYIALPHFYMSGNFNARTGSVPSVGVNWYRRAATEGALFTTPQLIGVGDAAQGELLIGEDTLYKNIEKAAGGGSRNVTINVYGAQGQNIDDLANVIMYKMQHEVDKKGAVYR